MPEHMFISYSPVDGEQFALRLADNLSAGTPPINVWVDKRELHQNEYWDEQILGAIRDCKGMLFVMTPDSVQGESVCKDEWVKALKYKKPLIPLLAHVDAELPFRLGSREYVDFTGTFEVALARLRRHLAWIDTPEGQLQQLKYRLADAQRELPRAQPDQLARVRDDIAALQQQIARQQAVIDDPGAARERVQQSIDRGLELVREPTPPGKSAKKVKFVNQLPAIAPKWFEDRYIESGQIADFLKDGTLRVMTVVGRGGMGKTAMVCRLLKSLESGDLPDDLGPLSVDGIVYLSNARSFNRVTAPELFLGLTQLLPAETAARLDAVYKNPQSTPRDTMEALLKEFSSTRTVVLLDSFEDALDAEGRIKDSDLSEALRAVLELPGLKVIITTRVAPLDLAGIEPGRQRRLELDKGLDHPFAENVLRAMDADGRLGLRDAPDGLLTGARTRTRGNPRALEHLFGILSADRDTTLKEILEDTKRLLPERVLDVLVGEAFGRLGSTAQRVMQALAIYRYPVPAAAVDYLLQPYVPGVDSAPLLRRLVNMQFARGESKSYYLEQGDRNYALSRLPEGTAGDWKQEPAPLSRFALTHRAAEWFKQSRKPSADWKNVQDLAPQLFEYELRLSGQEYDEAAAILLEIDFDYLILWGHFQLTAQLHQNLQDHIEDPGLAIASANSLGTAYWRMGQYQQAISGVERALSIAREQQVPKAVASCLLTLGAVYADQGDNAAATDHYQNALALFRALKDPRGEACVLGNLANQSLDGGRTDEAIEYHIKALAGYRQCQDQQGEATTLANLANAYRDLGNFDDSLRSSGEAHRLAQDIGYRLIEMASLTNMANTYVDTEDLAKGIEKFGQAIELADAAGNNQVQHEARSGLAMAHLYRNELTGARAVAEAARQHNFPLGNHWASMMAGVICQRQADETTAREAFHTALTQSDDLLSRNPNRSDAFDVKGLAWCGLALCENTEHVAPAEGAFRQARSINSAAGVVRRMLRLFDELAKSDKSGLLRSVRTAVAGTAA